VYAILVPTCALLVLTGLMSFEGNYTFATRGSYFAPEVPVVVKATH